MVTPGSYAPSRFAGLSLHDGMVRVVVLQATRPAEPASGPVRRLGPGELIVVDAAEAALPSEVVVDGRVRDNVALGQRLGQLWSELGLGGVPTFLGVQPADALVQVLELGGGAGAGAGAGTSGEVSRCVDAMRARYREDPVWCVALLEPDVPLSPAALQVRVVGCRREDLSAAAWAARRSGIWVAGIKLNVSALAELVERPRTGGLVWLDRSGEGPATVAVFGGAAAPGLRAVGPLPADCGDGLVSLQLLVGAASINDASLAAWAMALEPGVEAAQRAESVAGLVARARFEVPRLGGAVSALATDSPRPVDECASALGLALSAAGVGPKTDDLQRSLLQGGVGAIEGRRALSRSSDLLSEGTNVGLVAADALGTATASTGTSTSTSTDGRGPGGRGPTAVRSGPAVSGVLPPPPAQSGMVRSAGLLHGGSLQRSRGEHGQFAGSTPGATGDQSDSAAHPLAVALPFRAWVGSNRRAPAWVHRAGLFRGQPHVAVLDGDHLELRGAVSQAIVAQQVRRSAARLFGAEAVTGELCIHPDSHPDAANGVRWDRRLSFAAGESELLFEHDEILDELADLLEDYPWASVVIEGHSDGRGDLGDNLRLSRARADAVAEVLIAEGCDVARIEVHGRGPFVPLTFGDTPAIRALHRRVDVTLLGLLA
ncbi:MAG: OmpA family protein [Acidimicrobiales bacterium]